METTILDQQILENIHSLSVEQKRDVLNFIQLLNKKSMIKRPRRDIKGLCADLKIQITEADIDEARQEMWGNFPREIV